MTMQSCMQEKERFGFTGDDAWFPRLADEEAKRSEGAISEATPLAAQEKDLKSLAPVIAVVGGSGGVGRSSIALLMAYFAAKQGVDTVLLEGDLQFGDMAFWLGLDDSQPSLATPGTCEPVRCELGFDLYKAPVFPEAADEIVDELALNLGRLREERGLVIADTGSYWSGFTATLLLQSDLFLMMADQRPASVAAAIKASELCSRLGIPSTRMIAVYNRWSSKCTLSAKELKRALGAGQVCCIPDGKECVDEAVRTGDVRELEAQGSPVVAGVCELLKEALPRVGIHCQQSDSKKKGLFK